MKPTPAITPQVVPPDDLRPSNHAFDRPADRLPDRDAMRSSDRGHYQVLHEKRVVADGSSELVAERFLDDGVGLERNRAAPDLVQEIDAQ